MKRSRVSARLLARFGLYAILIITPWLYGGAAARAVVLACVALGIVLTVALLGRASRSQMSWTPTLLLVLAALSATVLQLVPLPRALLNTISPGTAEVLRGVGIEGAHSVSLDPPMTFIAVFQLVALVFAVLIATTTMRKRGRLRELLCVVGAYGAGLTLIGLVNLLFRHGEESSRFLTVAFINPNHFGGFVAFACFASISAALGMNDSRRWLFVGTAAVCALGTLLSLSRGAIGALAIVSIAFVVLTLIRWNAWKAARWVAPMMVATTLAGVSLLWAALAREMRADEAVSTKIDIWKRIPSMLADFPFFGIGRGAFPSAFTRYDLTRTQLRFTHVENSVLQTLVDYGPIVGAALVVLVVLCLRRAVAKSIDRADRAAACCAVLVLAVHNLVDFNTALLGVALPAVLVLTLLTANEPRRQTNAEDKLALDKRWPSLAFAITASAAIAAVPAVARRTGADTRLTREMSAKNINIEYILDRHPADWVLPALAAEAELRRRDLEHAMRHINRAMFLAPYSDVPHRLAARALLSVGRKSQAALEYRLASQLAPQHIEVIIAEMLSAGATLDDVPSIADNAPELMLPVGRVLMDRKAPKQALRALLPAVHDEDAQLDALDLAARASLDAHELDVAARLAKTLEQRAPSRVTAYLVAATVQQERGADMEALQTLERGRRNAHDDTALVTLRVGVLMQAKRYAEAHDAVTWLLEHATSERAAAEAHYYRGNLFRAEGRTNDALGAYQLARDLAPTEVFYRLVLAGARQDIGDIDGAAAELDRARSELGQTPELDERRERLRRRPPR